MKRITDEEVGAFFDQVEEGKTGFELGDWEDMFHHLIWRRRRIVEGSMTEIKPRRWPVLGEHFGGLASEDLMVLTGETGRGKTTFFLNYALDLIQQGHTGFVACLEGGYSAFCKRVAEVVLEKKEKSWVDTDIGAFREITKNQAELYTYKPAGIVQEDRILLAMKYAVLKHQVKFCVVDHLGFVDLNLRMGMTEASAIGKFLQRIKGFNSEYAVPVMMIAHPAKSGDKGYREREVGMDELKGSSDIKQLADTVVSLFKAEEETCIRFQKIRNSDYARNTGRGVAFVYDDDRSRLTEACGSPQEFGRSG